MFSSSFNQKVTFWYEINNFRKARGFKLQIQSQNLNQSNSNYQFPEQRKWNENSELIQDFSVPLCWLSTKSSFKAFTPKMLLVSHSVVSHSLVTPWTVAFQAPLSMEFSRQEYWSGLRFPPLTDLPNPGIAPTSPALAGGFWATWEAITNTIKTFKNGPHKKKILKK